MSTLLSFLERCIGVRDFDKTLHQTFIYIRGSQHSAYGHLVARRDHVSRPQGMI